MKKFLFMLLIVLMVVTFAACKQPEPGNSEPVTKAQGQENLYKQGASGSGKSIDHTGFRIAVKVTEMGDETDFEIGGKNDIYWYALDDTTVFVKAKDKTNYYYASPYTVGIPLPGTTIKNYIFTFADALLYVADALIPQMTKGADDTVSGRACATYTVTVPYETETPGVYANMKLKIWSDKEYGFTMKMTYEDTGSGSYANSFSYQITKLELKDASTPDGYNTVKDL